MKRDDPGAPEPEEPEIAREPEEPEEPEIALEAPEVAPEPERRPPEPPLEPEEPMPNGASHRPDRADLVVVAGAVAATIVLVAMGLGLTFFADEWAVIEDRSISLESFLRPFNEHWLGLQTTVYRIWLELFGLGSYVPFHALLVALHVIVGLEVYVLARRATRPELAAAIAIVVLFFGSGFENLFWAMQIGFVGAVALGLGAVIVLDGGSSSRRVLAAGILLTLTVMTSGYGLFVLAFAGLDLLVARRWRALPAAIVPGLVYLAWFLTLGRTGVTTTAGALTPEAILAVPGFILEGAGFAVGSALGLGPAVGSVVSLVFLGWLVISVVLRRPVAPRVVACAGAIVFEYALLGLTRSQLPVDAALYTRYAYLAGILALIGLASLAGRFEVPAAGGARLAWLAVGGGIVALALVWNVRLLAAGRELFLERADMTRALVSVALERPLPDVTDPDRTLILVPSPNAIERIVAEHGDPRTDSLVPWAVRPIPQPVLDEALRRLIEGAPIPGLDGGS